MTHAFIRFVRPLLLLAIAAAALAVPHRAAAQTDTVMAAQDTVYAIRLTDGSVLYGRVIEERGDQVVVLTSAGATVTLDRAQIASMEIMRGRVVGGRVWQDDPHATRLFFGPTARSIEKGKGYFGVYELFFPFVSYGVTDRFTISGGTPIIPELIGQVFYVAPKYEVIRTPGASAAVGVLALFATTSVESGSAGLLYAVGTVGSPDRALSVGATVPFYTTGEDSEVGDVPVFMVGGEARLGARTKAITENYFSTAADGGLLSAGVRFFGERLSADFGLGMALFEDESGCCLPLLNFVYSF